MSTTAVPPILTIDSNPAIQTELRTLFAGERVSTTTFDEVESEILGGNARSVLG